jgi:hypothetical protein
MATKTRFTITTQEIQLPAERGGGRGLRITCAGDCRMHTQPTSADMRHPGEIPGADQLHRLLRDAHSGWAKAASAVKYGPWAA